VGDAYFTNNLGPDAEDALVDALHDYARVNNLAIQPFTQVTGPTAGDDDRPVLRRIARRLSDLGLCVGEVDERPTDLRVLEHARLVVSIRMHTAIASLIHGRPTVVLSYLSSKVTGLKQFAHGVAIVEDAHFARSTLTRCFVSVEAASAGVSTEAAEIWAREISQWL